MKANSVAVTKYSIFKLSTKHTSSSVVTNLKTKEHIRPTLIILLIITAFIGLLFVGVGSHGSISMKNKETASIIYGGIVFVFCVVINLISMRESYSVFIGFMSFILNLLSGLILVIYLISSINFNINGGHFPILFLLVIGIEIILSGLIIRMDLRELNKNWLQQRT